MPTEASCIHELCDRLFTAFAGRRSRVVGGARNAARLLRAAIFRQPRRHPKAHKIVRLGYSRKLYARNICVSRVPRLLVRCFRQHDVQELCRVLLDNLESKMSDTAVQETIPKLLKGLMRSYVRCIDVNFESSRDEYFYDVQLNVKGRQNSQFAACRHFVALRSSFYSSRVFSRLH